jgi:hypothetical protein
VGVYVENLIFSAQYLNFVRCGADKNRKSFLYKVGQQQQQQQQQQDSSPSISVYSSTGRDYLASLDTLDNERDQKGMC